MKNRIVKRPQEFTYVVIPKVDNIDDLYAATIDAFKSAGIFPFRNFIEVEGGGALGGNVRVYDQDVIGGEVFVLDADSNVVAFYPSFELFERKYAPASDFKHKKHEVVNLVGDIDVLYQAGKEGGAIANATAANIHGLIDDYVAKGFNKFDIKIGKSDLDD